MKTVVDVIEENSLSAPVNIEGMIRGVGVALDKKADLTEGIAGEISMLSDGDYKISVNKNDHYYRQRFTMAHELGHFIFHRELIGDGVDDNKMYRSVEEGNFYNTKVKKIHETEANRFAAVVLMPKELLLKSWEDGEKDIPTLAKEFQVSQSAMEIRLKNLGVM